MARPQKTGLDYFPVDTTWERNMLILKAKYQLVGIGCIIELYSAIYREGYFLPWDADTKALFMAANCIDEITLDGIIELSTSKGIFDARLLEEHKILTSHGIQERWAHAYRESRRKLPHIEPDYDLTTGNYGDNSPVPAKDAKTPVESTHIILHNNKVKDIILGEFANIALTEPERDRLVSELGQAFFDRLITFYSAWKKEKSPKTKDDNLTIRRWVIDAMRERDAKHPPKPEVQGRADAWTPEKQAAFGRELD
jgi:hypothetical protein